MSNHFYLPFSLLLFFVISLTPENDSDKQVPKEITLTISFPKSKQRNLITSFCEDLSNDLRVVIKNNTDTIASFYNFDNFWGMYNLAIEVSTPDTVYRLHKEGGNPDSHQRHPRSCPLFPGDSLVFETNLQSCKCDSLSGCFINMPKRSLSKAKLKAIYHLEQEGHQWLIAGDSIVLKAFLCNKGRNAELTTAQIITSFVAEKLISKEYDVQFETEANK